MTRIPLISLAILFSLVHIASADDGSQELFRNNTRRAFQAFASRRQEVRTHAHAAAGLDSTRCRGLVADARQLEMQEADEWTHVCDDFAAAEAAEPALDAAKETYNWIELIGFDADKFSKETIPYLTESAKKCTAELDRAVSAGAPPELVETFGKARKDYKLAEWKDKICKPLADMITKYGDDPEGMQRARWEEKAKPYRAVGIKGDRLDLLVDHIDYAMYGVGGGELTTPKQLKTAKIIFEELSDDDGWTVRRYVFKGDKLVSTTSKGYLLKPGAKAFR